MHTFKFTSLAGILLAAGLGYQGTATAALTGSQTATVTFATAGITYGWANIDPTVTISPNGLPYTQNGVTVGVVRDPLDNGTHFHIDGNTAATRIARYEPDTTGFYVRLSDTSHFSLQSLFLDTSLGEPGGNFVIYGYANAYNNLLGSGTPDPNFPGYYLDNADPEGGLVAPTASYVFANNGSQNTVTLNQLLAQDAHWANIAAFWITFQNFNNSPTTHYGYDITPPYPDWTLLVDNIVLGSAQTVNTVPTPIPAAAWLFGAALSTLIGLRRKRPAP